MRLYIRRARRSPQNLTPIENVTRPLEIRESDRRNPTNTVAVAMSIAVIILLIATSLIFFIAYIGQNTISLGGGNHSVSGVKKLQQVWNALTDDYYLPVDENLMIEYAATAIPAALGDVYTEYLPADVMRQFSERTSGHYAGIGIFVAESSVGRLCVTGMYEESPAALAGVWVGDEIVAVDGTDVSMLEDGDAVIERVRGDIGTNVSVRFFRPSTGEYIETNMKRDNVKVKNIRASVIRVIDESAAGEIEKNQPKETAATNETEKQLDTAEPNGAAGGIVSLNEISEIIIPLKGRALTSEASIGYIGLSMFDQDASTDVAVFIDKLTAAGVQGLVIDLRDNTGGDFDESVKIADQLLGEGVITSVESRDSKNTYSSDSKKIDLPYCILINNNSASASEVVSGAVKDHGAGVLVGEKSFGKGLVQLVMTLADGSGLKYTQSRYFTPSGASIHGAGIEPDITVALADEYKSVPAAAVPIENDAQLLAAIDSFSAFVNP